VNTLGIAIFKVDGVVAIKENHYSINPKPYPRNRNETI
jgi:hypothetical protein